MMTGKISLNEFLKNPMGFPEKDGTGPNYLDSSEQRSMLNFSTTGKTNPPTETPTPIPMFQMPPPPNDRYGAVVGNFNPVDDRGGGVKTINLAPSLYLPKKTANEVWFICGKRGSGKSYLLGKLCEELTKLEIPFIIIDVKNAHSLIRMPDLTHVHMTKISPGAIINRLGQRESFIVSCKGMSLDDIREYVTNFSNAINRIGFGPTFGTAVMVAMEECHNFVGQGQGTAGGDDKIRKQCVSAVDRLVREGRQDGVGAIFVSQSVQNVMSNIRRQSEIKILFNIKDSTDISALRKSLIGKDRQEVERIIERVYNFGVGEFICVSPTYIGGPGLISDKTSPRMTEHAGRSFLDDDGMGAISDSFTLEPEDYESIETDGNTPIGEPDELEDEMTAFTAPKKHMIDLKSALGLSLLAVSLLGIVVIILKKRMEQQRTEQDKKLDQQLSSEKRRIEAIKEQNAKENAGQIETPISADLGDIIPTFADSPDYENDDPFTDLDKIEW